MAMRPFTPALALSGLALFLAACSDGDPTQSTACTTSSTPVALAPLQGTTVRAAEFGRCFQIQEAGDYLLVPQFASEGPEPETRNFETPDPFGFQFGVGLADDAATTAASVSRAALPWAAGEPRTANPAARFHAMLRRKEAELDVRGAATARAAAAASLMTAQVAGGPPPASRTFRVLSDLDGEAFETVTASLKFAGGRIWLYVDANVPEPGFTDADWAAFGRLFDDDLLPIDETAFGTTSDVDGNEHVFVLFTPVVNALVQPTPDNPATNCRFYVAGFFTGFDLAGGGDPNSNAAEVFYSSVPDPNGVEGCPVQAAQVRSLTPATFIHEMQHMISFNQHRLIRGGRAENVWLNEGLSLIAEELGGRHYEERYPPPSGRTSPTQLFPDSALGFLQPNLNYAFDWLTMTSDSSVTTFDNFGSLEERGGAWLFLRWLGDQKGDAIYRSLVQTNRRGIANVSAAAGENFPQLFGDFSVAVYTDSLPGIARSAIPPRYRFSSRNFRYIFQLIANQGSGDGEYPVSPIELAVGQSDSNDMPQGGLEFYRVRQGATSPLSYRFSREDRTQLASSLAAQVTIFRLPDAP
jgi:hypothetical protein